MRPQDTATPEAVHKRRMDRIGNLILASTLGLCGAAFALLFIGGPSSFLGQIAIYIFGLAMLIAIPAGFSSLWRGRRRVLRRAIDCCPECGYSHRGLNEGSACPECGANYVRSIALLPPERTQVAAPNGKPKLAPWESTSLRDAFTRIEQVARAHGHCTPRFPVYTLDLNVRTAHLLRPLPADLHTFYHWFDSTLWSCFVGTTAAKGDHSVSPQSFEALALAASIDRLAIRQPHEIRVATLAELAESRADCRTFAEQLAALGRSSDWLQTQMVEFVDSVKGGTVFYCTDPPADHCRGCIVTFQPNHPDRVWLADSLAAWLCRLAAFDGAEVAFEPPADSAREELFRHFETVFGKRNTNLHRSSDEAAC